MNIGQKKPRIPLAYGELQFNFCKNPRCVNYGIPPKLVGGSGRRGAAYKDTYTLTGGGNQSTPAYVCNLCGATGRLKSNLGISEEIKRIQGSLANSELGCPTDGCQNTLNPPLTSSKEYTSNGFTKAGSLRFRCKACGRVFTHNAKKIRQSKRPDISRLVFSLLINKMPMRRICETADIEPATLYGKIRQIHQQCIGFAARQEAKLRDGAISLERLYLSMDRQDYTFNWGTSLDRRNSLLSAIGSADEVSGYVFGMHLNFDPNMESEVVERDAIEIGDYELPYPHRRYARIWLQRDYRDGFRQHRRNSRKSRLKTTNLASEESLTDVDEGSVESGQFKLPANGVQVHAEYTMYAHFYYLSHLLQHTKKIRLFLDQDSGMRAGSLGAFCERIKQRTVDVFFVRVAKELSTSQKKALVARSAMEYAAFQARYPNLKRHEIELIIIKERMNSLPSPALNGDQWLMHPFSDMSEPEKAVCYITNFNDMDPDHLAALYRKASLHAIDRFFMLLRRRISILERPIQSASASGRMWFGYAAYNPAVAIALMEIFRVVHNFVLIGADKKTPAMRLGLIDRPVTLDELIHIS